MLTCQDIDRILHTDALDGAAEDLCAEVHRHLDECPPCQDNADKITRLGAMARGLVDGDDQLCDQARDAIVSRCLGCVEG